jgi:hypothetical protein
MRSLDMPSLLEPAAPLLCILDALKARGALADQNYIRAPVPCLVAAAAAAGVTAPVTGPVPFEALSIQRFGL